MATANAVDTIMEVARDFVFYILERSRAGGVGTAATMVECTATGKIVTPHLVSITPLVRRRTGDRTRDRSFRSRFFVAMVPCGYVA